MSRSFLDGVLSGVVASIIFAGIAALTTLVQCHYRSAYSGQWRGIIYADEERTVAVKQDEYDLRHNPLTHLVKGSIHRVVTPDKSPSQRQWKCIGVIHGDHMMLCYWRFAAQKSYGCIYLRLTEDNTYDGYYLCEHTEGIIEKIPIRLQKITT